MTLVKHERLQNWVGVLGAAMSSLLLIALPKCPLCLSGYAVVLSCLGAQVEVAGPDLITVAYACIFLFSAVWLASAVRRSDWWIIGLAVLGVAAAASVRLLAADPLLGYGGAALLGLGAMMNDVRCRGHHARETKHVQAARDRKK